MSATSPGPLVGRDAIMAEIRRALDGARSGLSRVSVISGPPGVGKSAVLEQARREAVDCTILATQGIESESELAYASLQQLLRPLATLTGTLPPVQRDALEAALGTGTGSSEPMLVGLGLLGLLAEAAEERTVLCLLDDVQWLDSASRRAVAFASRRLNAERVAVVAAQRTREGSPRFAKELGVEEWIVPPLTEDEEIELLRQLAADHVPHSIGRRIHGSTSGFPLATVALGRLLTQDQLTGRHPLPEPLPMGAELRDIFDESLRSLPAPAQRLLLLAAADDSGLAAAVMRSVDEVGADQEALEVLEQADLLSVDHGFIEFRHPLVRSVVYQSATAGDRRAAHGALADSYAEMGDDERRVWHRALGALPPDQAIAEELAETAQASDRRRAYAAASAGYELAASLTGRLEQEAEMLVAAASSAWLAGKLDHAMSLAERAHPLISDPVLLANLDFVRGGIHLGRGQAETAYELLVGAGQRIAQTDVDGAIRIWALASEGVSFAGNRVAATNLARVVESVDTSERGAVQRLSVEMILGVGDLFNDELTTAMGHFRGALAAVGPEAGIPELAAAARVAMYLGDDDRSISFGVRAVERAKADGTVAFIPMAGGRLSLLEVMTGQFTLALATADETIRLAADTHQPELGVQCLAWSALVMAYRGGEEECRRFIARARRTSEGRPLGSVADALAWAEGALELSLGNVEGARLHLGRIDHPGISIMAGLDAIESAGRLGNDQAELVERATSYAAATGERWARARASYGRALMSPGPEAEVHFEESLRCHAGSARVFEQARTQLAYGSWLRRNRRRRDAREHLQAAFDGFETLAASPWMGRAQAEIRATGGSSRPGDTRTFDRLTPQEMQVARLVTGGMTNRDAATHLFLSPRTVEYHLRNIYVKLAVTSRTELAGLRLDDRLAADP